jgi:hypothetical protein
MWKGILVKGDAILNVQQQSIIENAEYGVSLAGGAVQVFISNTTFNRNGIGINYHGGLQPFTGVSVLQQLENCTFDCTAALIPPYLGQIDYHDWSYCGLFLEKTPDISLITPNIFKNMNNGIVASLLNLNIENNTFTNITAHAGFNYEHDGSAMVMKGLDKTPYPVSFRQRGFGGGFNSPNSIEDCDRAFYLVETTCNIQSNTIIGKRGIYAFLGKLSEEKDNQGPLLPTFVIKDNYIRSVEACIELDNCRGASISNNLLAFYGSGTPNQSTQAVLSIVSAYQNPDAQYGIRNNVIANSYGYGIVLNGIKDVAVTDNNLLLTPSTQQVGLTRSSILLSNTREAQISCNKIEINGAVSSTASTTNIYPCGVSIENAVGNTLSCNTFNGVQNGILVSGGCTGGRGLETKIQHNEFASTTPVGTGIWIRGGATLDNQFSATENYGNEWQTPQGTASYTVAGARHDGQRIGISFTGQFKAAQGTKYYPPSFLVSANTPPTSGDGWFSDRSSFAISQCPILPSGFCATNPLAFTNVDIDADIAIAEGIEYASELTDEVYKWDARTLYEKLKEDPSLVFNDAILETFRDSLDATFWEDLYQIAKKQKEADFANKAGDEVLHDQKIAAALQQNASLSSSELCVQNEKYTNEIYLRSFAKGIDIKQIAGIANPADVLPTLTSIAQQCPVIGGPAVYHARAMLYHYQPTVYDDHALCAQQGAVFRTAKPKDKDGSKNGGNKFSISPNPASNFVILKANQPLIEDTVISIFDTFGRIVQVQYLINGSDKWSISTNSLMSGVYYIKIANTVQKIIISH